MALTEKLGAIGDAIRAKTGGTELLTLDAMPTAIESISGAAEPVIEALSVTSNGTYTAPNGVDGYSPVTVNVPQDGGPPESAFVLSGDCSYMFANSGWNWFIEQYGNKITTENINNARDMFYGYSLSEIPFDINLSTSSSTCEDIFSSSKIKKPPYIKGKVKNLSNLFYVCNYLNEIPDDWADYIDFSNIHNSSTSDGYLKGFCFSAHSIRKIPNNLLSQLWSKASNLRTLYYQGFYMCYTLDEVTDIPIHGANLTSNSFAYFCYNCCRLKNMTFATQNNGIPFITNWKNQTIELVTLGYTPSNVFILNYNSGITADKEVTDDVTYQALKNDPDWFTTDVAYSRYNHDSAVATINSLPDTSAYLASAGGTNTIKFKGAAGSATDGGAINTLTEEEIAVATAKGWTVTLV